MDEMSRHYLRPDDLAVLIRDIETTLFWERKGRHALNDKYLRDYHLPFRGMTDNWSVPESMWREYQALEKREAKASVVLTGDGFSIMRDEYGNVVVQTGGRQHSEFTSAKWVQFLQLANALPLGTPTGPTPSGQASAPVGDQAMKAWEHNPEIGRAHEKAMQEMEKWANASSQYPKHG